MFFLLSLFFDLYKFYLNKLGSKYALLIFPFIALSIIKAHVTQVNVAQTVFLKMLMYSTMYEYHSFLYHIFWKKYVLGGIRDLAIPVLCSLTIRKKALLKVKGSNSIDLIILSYRGTVLEKNSLQ